jgi:hypothetical protein
MADAVRQYLGPTETGLTPDADQILRQMTFWFGDQMSGQIDIGWVGVDSGRLNQFRRFDLDQLEDLAEFVCEVNRLPGQSVYFRPALVRADSPKFVTDLNFERATGIWADLDAPGAAENVRNVAPITRANMVVVTGKHPHLRAQLFWRLSESAIDAGSIRDLNVRASALFGGDSLVINPTSLMRVAGTIAWPWKPGRVPEMTELHLFSDRPQSYPFQALARTFPEAAAQTPAALPGQPAGTDGLFPDRPSVERLIRKIREGVEWHNNTLRLVAHLVAKGRASVEILAMAEHLTLPGYTVDQTRYDLEKMIRGARDKWNIPEPESAVEEPEEVQAADPLEATPLGTLDPGKLPRREWIIGHRMIRKFVTLTIAPGGSGKSLLTMEEMIAVATGSAITGQEVHVTGPTWIYNNEDPLDELQRRIAAICLHHKIPLSGSVSQRLFLNSGRDRRLVVAKMLNSAVVQTPDVEALQQAIEKRGIVAMTIDPFVRVHQVDENDNAAIDAVADIFGLIADRTGCAFNLVHHTRKSPSGSSGEAQEGVADNARGAGALVAAARIAQTVLPMSKADAEALGIPADQRRWYVRLDDAKANMSPPAEAADWFKWVSVPLGNGGVNSLGLEVDGDDIGVLEPWAAPDMNAQVEMSVAMAILRDIDSRWRSGSPFAQKGARSLRNFITSNYGLSGAQAKRLVADWINNGMVASEIFDAKSKAAGLRVLKWPGTVD